MQQECIKYLKSEGIYHINIHGGGWAAKGSPDLIACVNGYFVAFEFKVDQNDEQSDQRIHEKRILRNGGMHYSPRSLQEFVVMLRTIQDSNRCMK